MSITNCRHFNGYKPCTKSTDCSSNCSHIEIIQQNILIIHLEALGAVLRATCILPSLKRLYPHAKITWLTKSPADQLLINNPYLDRIVTTKDYIQLAPLKFDLALCIDKSLEAASYLRVPLEVNEIRGFFVNSIGNVIPANEEAKELWELGLDNNKKFFINQKTENQLLIESLKLGSYCPIENSYQIALTKTEKDESNLRRSQWLRSHSFVIGINTGCSPTIPYKKWTIEYHREIIKLLKQRFKASTVLLGGQEDELRNNKISENLDVILSPTDKGIRDGLSSVQACDIVISGDSLGMHMAIGLKKKVVAWFGPTCAQEIEMYGRGIKILSKASCSPCWKRECQKPVMCFDQVSSSEIINAVENLLDSRPMQKSEIHFDL